MIALCVDDEVLLLETLKRALAASPDVHEVAAFDDEHEALAWAETHRVDVAFLDIRLHDMTGLELAERLREIHPRVPLVFCTGFREYALDAFELHASGYLTKPIRAAAVQRELDNIRENAKRQPLLHAHCFGTFEIYANGIPIYFKRAKTKEMLAYLIDRRGAAVSAKDLCALLWEDKVDDTNYLHQIASDLRKGLKGVGAEGVFLSRAQGYSVDPTLIDCDYYRFLEGDPDSIRRFNGEYMSNYSWSEYTTAYLQRLTGGPPKG